MTPGGQLELTAPDPLADAIAWKRKNPSGYAMLIDLARTDVANGARPCIDLYVNILRRPHFASLLGLRRSSPSLLIDNTLRADLARLLRREYGFQFATRKAKADQW